MNRDKLILSNLSLVYYVLNNMTINYNDYDDLANEGIIGLINAVDTFKEDKNIAFSTYAYKCIKNQIIYNLRKPKIICISLNTEIGEGITIEDTIESNEPDILEKLIYQEIIANIKDIIKNTLSEEKRYLIFSLYGIGCKKKNQRDLAEEFGCRQGTVSKWQNALVKKVKTCYN